MIPRNTMAYINVELSGTIIGGTTGFIGKVGFFEYWMHPEHLVQNKLTISAQGTGANAQIEGLDGYTLNYIVYLEEYDITPDESIIFNIKGKAQNVSG